MEALKDIIDLLNQNSGPLAIIIAVFALIVSVSNGKSSKKKQENDVEVFTPESSSNKDIGQSTIKPVDSFKRPAPAPAPKERKLTEAEIVKKKIELIKQFPELSIIEQKKDRFLSLLVSPDKKEEVPTGQQILKARRLTDMLYKHQNIFLGEDADFGKLQLFNAILSLVMEDEEVK